MNNIKKLRKEQGLSVTELAAKLNMSQSNLTKIENEQIDLKPDTAEKIASVLNVSPQALTTHKSSLTGTTELELLNPAAINLPPLSRLAIPNCFINTPSDTTVLFITEDDAMEPLVKQGSIVLIDKSCQTLNTAGIYLININDKTLLRRLQYNFDDSITIISEHKVYPPQRVLPNTLKIIGKACCIYSVKTV
ncbi:MAG: LexA family transcriptional regulator [Acetobacter sp.]|nr:LexA family transcriptional regulator [Acetobacter sp.]